MDPRKVFSQDDTLSSNAAWTILRAPFEEQIGDLAQVLSASLPQEERPNFVAEYANKARKAVAALETENDAEPDPETIAKLTQESIPQKLAVLEELVAVLQSKGLVATSVQELEGFANLFLALLIHVDAPVASFDATLQVLLKHLQSSNALHTILNLLPADACTPTVRFQILVKSIQTTERPEQRTKAILSAPSFLQQYSASEADSDAAVLELTDLCLKHDALETALALLESYQPTSGALQRKWLRLALAKSTQFSFPSTSAPEQSIVSYVFSEADQLDDALLSAEAPPLSKDALQVKRSALSIAKLFAGQIGQKVSYGDILAQLPKPDASLDEDVLVESAVIDEPPAIKSKLVQARLSQPQRLVTVVSSRYAALPHLDGQDDLAKWKTIQSKLVALKANLQTLNTSLDSAIGASGQTELVNGGKEVEAAA